MYALSTGRLPPSYPSSLSPALIHTPSPNNSHADNGLRDLQTLRRALVKLVTTKPQVFLEQQCRAFPGFPWFERLNRQVNQLLTEINRYLQYVVSNQGWGDQFRTVERFMTQVQDLGRWITDIKLVEFEDRDLEKELGEGKLQFQQAATWLL